MTNYPPTPKKHTIPRKFFLQLGIWIFSVFVFFILFSKALDVYVDFGEEVFVPKITQLSFQEAIDSLSASGLTYRIQDTQLSTLLPTGYILFQYPDPGSRVKRERTISLVVAALNVQRNYFPNIIGENLRTAAFKLNELGIKIKDTMWVDTVSFLKVHAAYVGEKLIEVGKVINPRDSVILYVGSKQEQLMTVPNLSGLAQAEAIIMLQSSGLSLGTVFKQETSGLSMGIIVKQSPAPFDEFGNQTLLPSHSLVDIWIE